MPDRGHRGIRRYFEDITSAWEEWRVDLHWIAPVPDRRIIIEMTMVALGKGSGAPAMATMARPLSHALAPLGPSGGKPVERQRRKVTRAVHSCASA
jgi:hypothetical protein